jgi:hypothetical protein
MEGAERRGIAITRRINEKFEVNGLRTVPDFPSAWIDALVSVELIECGTAPENSLLEGNDAPGDLHISGPNDLEQAVDPLGLSEGEEAPPDKSVAPVAEALNSPVGAAGVIEVPVSSPIDAVIRVSSIPSANRGVVSVLPTDRSRRQLH